MKTETLLHIAMQSPRMDAVVVCSASMPETPSIRVYADGTPPPDVEFVRIEHTGRDVLKQALEEIKRLERENAEVRLLARRVDKLNRWASDVISSHDLVGASKWRFRLIDILRDGA